MRSPAIALNQVTFSYPGESFCFTFPDLSITSGEHIAFIGSSGCGKTTLANLISGILPQNSGSIRVLDHELSTMNDAGRRTFRSRDIGFVFQEFELLDYLPGSQNILLPYHLHPELGLTPATKERMHALASKAGVEHLLHRYPQQMSQGERQRIAICRALITEPSLIIADEPTGNLAPDQSNEIMRHIHQTVRDHQATLITITHDHHLLEPFDRVIDLSQQEST